MQLRALFFASSVMRCKINGSTVKKSEQGRMREFHVSSLETTCNYILLLSINYSIDNLFFYCYDLYIYIYILLDFYDHNNFIFILYMLDLLINHKKRNNKIFLKYIKQLNCLS